MKMDRNLNPDGAGKYALVNLRKLRELEVLDKAFAEEALNHLQTLGVLESGNVGNEDEFFVVKLKDRHSTKALDGYADSIQDVDREFAEEVRQMAERSGEFSPFCKEPD